MRLGILALAWRRIALRPWRHVLTALVLAVVTAVICATLLFVAGIGRTADLVLAAGPSLVVARVDAGGWAAMPVADAEKLRSVPGVTAVEARVWGVLPGPPLVTVIGDPSLPAWSGKVIVGPGVPLSPDGRTATLTGLDGAFTDLEVVGVASRDVDTVANDVAQVPLEVARRLLLLADGQATDLAITSVRPEEDAALVPEVALALGYPVRAGTRAAMRTVYHAQLGQRGGIALSLLLPSLLALLLLVSLWAAGGPESRAEVGRLKLLGWSTGDVLRLHLGQALLVAGAAIAVGLAGGHAAVHLWGARPLLALLGGWSRTPPHLSLDAEGAALVLLEVGALVLAPCLLAAALPAIRLGRTDPAELLEAD